MKEVKITVPEGMELVQEGNTYKLVEKEFELKVGRDYKHKRDKNLICIDRKENALNFGFHGKKFECTVVCSHPSEWEEATEEEIVAAFEKECVRRFGEDWKNIKLKKDIIGDLTTLKATNSGMLSSVIEKSPVFGWNVLNSNGVLYYNGEWNESLEKELPKTWEELGEIEGFYQSTGSEVRNHRGVACKVNRNLFPTKEQAEASLALAQLSQLREVYRDGWKPNWTYNKEVKYGIDFCENRIVKREMGLYAIFLSFQSEEVRNKFLKNFKDLIEKAKPLLG